MVAAMIRLRREPRPEGAPALPGGARAMGGVAALGFATTLAALVLAFIPAADEANKPLAVAKIVGLTLLLLGSGAAIYARSERARRISASRGIL